MTQRRLAAPDGPTSATVLPGSICRQKMADYRMIGLFPLVLPGIFIGKADIVKINAPLHLAKRDGVRFFRFHLFGEDLLDTLKPGHPVLILLKKGDQTANGR